MEPIEQPDHSAITERIQRIRNYLKSTLVADKEASSVLYRAKNEPSQGQRVAISEHDTRWKYSDDSVDRQNNWRQFDNFANHVLRNG